MYKTILLALLGVAGCRAQAICPPLPFTVSPASINLTVPFGESVPRQLITVKSVSSSPVQFMAYPDPAAAWMVLGSAQAVPMNTPSSFYVSFTLGGGVGTWSTNLMVTMTLVGQPEPCASLPIPVSVQIKQYSPQVTSVLNAASFANAPISPGELISIFGTDLGPTPAMTTAVTAGKVTNDLGQVSVILFDGSSNEVSAPLTYVGASQINAVVPYEVAGWRQAFLQVGYAGYWFVPKTPNVTLVATAPAIFTSTGTGSGQAAVLNPDGTANSLANPALRGSTIAVYLTGEGQTSPAGVTGAVTCSAGCTLIEQIPTPIAPVSAFVGGQPAIVAFAGEAPGLVAGVMQVNVTIPQNLPTGTTSLSVAVGDTESQAGITVTVK